MSVKLIDRGRRVRLTDRGRVVDRYARRMLALSRVRREMDDDGELTGRS